MREDCGNASLDHFAAPTAELCWKNAAPVSRRFDDCYFNVDDGLAETRHVFLQGNELPSRWPGCRRFTVGELGFGSGLNFLASWQAWEEVRTAGSCLNYFSVEFEPLSAADLTSVVSHWTELQPYAARLLRSYPLSNVGPLRGVYRLVFDCVRRASADDCGSVVLTLLIGDAGRELAKVRGVVDAWYLDGFSPAKNPELWSEDVLREVGRLSRAGTTAATFSSARAVRDRLQLAGFEVEKCPGYGQKREMVRGRYRGEGDFAETRRPPATAAVLGGGLAGTLAAHSLARRGIAVTLFEREGEIATGASGNAAGVVMPYPSAVSSAMNSFYLAGYSFALTQIEQLRAAGLAIEGDWCGALRLPLNKSLSRLYHAVADGAYPAEFAAALSGEQVSDLLGFDIGENAVFYPGAGWVSPGDYCRAAVAAPTLPIEVTFNQTAAACERSAGSWTVVDAGGRALASVDAVVVANAQHCGNFSQCAELPITSLRGQVMQPAASTESLRLKTVFCYENYLLPAAGGRHFLGATYDRGDERREVVAEHGEKLLDALAKRLPALAKSITAGPGRVGFRAVTPDHLPVVGQLEAGLYISVGHGSRGLITCGLAGEVVASAACGEPMPLLAGELGVISPERFSEISG